jgi:plastocyanin
MQSNYKITTITSNPARDLVYFYSGAKLIRAVSMVKEFSLSENGEKVSIYSTGLPTFDFDVFSLVDIDGTAYSELSPTQGAASQAYQTRLGLIMDQLGTIFKGCCDAGGGGGSNIQFQQDGVDFGTDGQYSTYNFTGATLTQTSPDTVEIDASGVNDAVVARIRRSTNQSIPMGGGWTDLVWNASAYEVGGNFWTSGADCTVPESGYYQVFVELSYDGSGLVTVMTSYAQMLLNGSVIAADETPVEINSIGSLWLMAQRYLSAGDVIKVQTRHSDASSHNVLAQGDHSPDIIFTKVGGVQAPMGQGSIQVQNVSVNVGTQGQYTTYNFTGGVTVTQTSPNTIEINVSGGSTGQVNIQFQDEGSNLGASGTVDTYNIVGNLHKGARVGNVITHTAPSVGENLQMTGLDPSNPLNAKIGAFTTNAVSWTASGSRQHNLSVTGWNDAWDGSLGTGKATIISFDGADWAILTGVAGGGVGRRMGIYNNTNELVILEHESTGSAAANRMFFDDAMPMYLMPTRIVWFTYIGGRWRADKINKFDAFDDFCPSNGNGMFNGNMMSYFNLTGSTAWGVSGAGQPSTQVGAVSASPAIGGRHNSSININSGYSGSGSNVCILNAFKIAFSGNPSGNKRIGACFGGYASGAGNYYAGAVVQSGFGFASDTGLPNAATNWFIYSGAGGAVNILASGLDSGIPIANAINNYNVFVNYFNPTTGVLKCFYSNDRMAYSFVGTRTGTPVILAHCLWYEAYGVALPTMYLDYEGLSSKFDTNR